MTEPLTLTYFDGRGRVEPARLLLELRGIPYQYKAIAVDDWRSSIKEQMFDRTPFGQLPILEDGGLVLAQSQAILRHLARKLELCGSTPAETAKIDEVCETGLDLLFDILLINWDPAFHEKRPQHREALGTKLKHVQAYFERISPDGRFWVTAGEVSAADSVMAYVCEATLPLHPGLLESFPKLDAMMRSFFAIDPIRAYVTSDRRPLTTTVPMAKFGGKPEETHQWAR